MGFVPIPLLCLVVRTAALSRKKCKVPSRAARSGAAIAAHAATHRSRSTARFARASLWATLRATLWAREERREERRGEERREESRVDAAERPRRCAGAAAAQATDSAASGHTGIVGRDVYPSLDMGHPSGWLLVALIWLACCATKVLTSMTLLGYACNQVERCPTEGSAEGPGFLQGVERFTLHGKTAPPKQ